MADMGPAILCLQMAAPMSAMATLMSVICKDKMAAHMSVILLNQTEVVVAHMSVILLNQTEVVVSLLVGMHECK